MYSSFFCKITLVQKTIIREKKQLKE